MLIVIGVIVALGALIAAAGWGKQVEAFANFGTRWVARALLLVLAAVVGIAVFHQNQPAKPDPSPALVASTPDNAAAPTGAAAAQPVKPLVVAIDTAVSGGALPVVAGRTNLPDGTVLRIQMSPCSIDCAPPGVSPFWAHPYDQTSHDPWPVGSTGNGNEEHSTVSHGKFYATGWSRSDREGLFPGRYMLEVWVYMNSVEAQPAPVRAILGEDGEAFQGPLRGDCCLDAKPETPLEKMRDDQFAASDPKDYAGEKQYIYYARYFDVASAPQAQDVPDSPSERRLSPVPAVSSPNGNVPF